MRRATMAAVVVAGALLVGCDGGKGPVTDAICADLRDGLSPMNLWANDAVRDGRDGDDFRAYLARHVRNGCPEQLDRYADYFGA